VRTRQRSPNPPPSRVALTRRVGVIADPETIAVRCMRCGLRWFPVRVLGKRGYRLPYQWWRGENDCNAPGSDPYDWSSDPVPLSTAPTTVTVATTITSTEALLNHVRRPCSGEVLSMGDLV
jgi:hypothetical protein